VLERPYQGNPTVPTVDLLVTILLAVNSLCFAINW